MFEVLPSSEIVNTVTLTLTCTSNILIASLLPPSKIFPNTQQRLFVQNANLITIPSLFCQLNILLKMLPLMASR